MTDHRYITEAVHSASSGPWEVDEIPETGECRVIVADPDETRPYILPITSGGMRRADADLLVIARTMLGPLVAEIQALEARLAKFEALATPKAPKPIPTDLADVIAAALDDALLCTRVWEAWAVGTMTEEDFTRAGEEPEFVDQIATAVVQWLARDVESDPAFRTEYALEVGGSYLMTSEDPADAEEMQQHVPGSALVTREVHYGRWIPADPEIDPKFDPDHPDFDDQSGTDDDQENAS